MKIAEASCLAGTACRLRSWGELACGRHAARSL